METNNSLSLSNQITSICGFPLSLPGIFIINSKPGGGKTHLIKYIFYCIQNIPAWGLLFSHTIYNTNNYPYWPKDFKHSSFDEDALINLILLQKAFEEGKRPLGCIVIDDMSSEHQFWYNKILENAITECRHLNLFIIIATQYINRIPPLIRECAFQIAIFFTSTKRAKQAAYESYGQDFETERDWNNFLSKYLQEKSYKFLYKDKDNGGNWELLRAPCKIPNFQINFKEIKNFK